MKNFILSLILPIIFILGLIFIVNYWIDPLNIFKNKNIENIYFGTQKVGEREKILAPLSFSYLNYKTIIIGTSKAKFVCNDSSIGNFGISGLKIKEILPYLNLIKKHNKEKNPKIYLFLDLEQFVVEDYQSRIKIEDKYFPYLLKYFSFPYLLESLEQNNLNKSLITSYPYVSKDNIFGQKKVFIKKHNLKETTLFLENFETNKNILQKSLKTLKKENIIIVINPSREYVIKKIKEKKIISLENELKQNYKIINLYNFQNNESNFIDTIHFHHFLGNNVWKEVIKKERI